MTLVLLISGFLLAGDAHGEDEVYYCAETDSLGFKDGGTGSYVRDAFRTEKFKINLNTISKTIELRDELFHKEFKDSSGNVINLLPEIYKCFNLIMGNENALGCVNENGRGTFQFNTRDGRFVLSSSGGYVEGFSDGDGKQIIGSISISYGTCDKF